MITGIDHVVFGVRDLAAAEAAYATLFGRAPSWRAQSGGARTVSFGLANMAFELMAPEGAGAAAERLGEAIARDGEGFMSLVLDVGDLDRAARRWAQVGLQPEAIAPGESVDETSGARRTWRRTRLGGTPGVRVFALTPDATWPQSEATCESPVLGLDHLVIRTPAPERALGFYGAKLGLDLRMDRTFADWGARLLFFRVGDAILEVAHDPKEVGDGPDRIWGATWRVSDIDAARARLAAAGLDVSEARAGRKPGTRVATVRTGACGAPTLLLQPATRD